ncbi:MAG TPA: glycosyltransferase family 1 protein [Clostridiales bacterium]|nr:glycosyltransferase family 1 protein [Clostridiales bacterium]
MRVLFIENTGNKSAGAYHSMIALIRYLRDYGVESFVAVSDKADGLDLLENNGIPYIKMRACAYTWIISKKANKIERFKMPFKYLYSLFASRALKKYVKYNNIDLIHENTSACYIGSFVSHSLHIPHIWHIREFLEEDFNAAFWCKRIALSHINKSDAVITVSDAITKKYEGLINNNIIHRIYNGIDVDFFYQKRKFRDIDTTSNIVCVGRVCEGKGQADAIKALAILKEKYNYTPQLYIAGIYTENYKESIMEPAKKCNIEKNIHFMGQVNDMKKLYKQMDILCMASHNEAFGRVTIEAMLSGLLVVGANSGGTAEIITNQKTGYLYKPGDAEELANSLNYVFQNKEEAKKVAICGQEYAKKQYDAKRNANEIYELYKTLI